MSWTTYPIPATDGRPEVSVIRIGYIHVHPASNVGSMTYDDSPGTMLIHGVPTRLIVKRIEYFFEAQFELHMIA